MRSFGDTGNMFSENIDMYRIPVPPSEQDVAQYRSLRLHALQSDPDSFSSNYAREEAFPLSEWYSRLDSPLKCTIAARLQVAGVEGSEVRWIGMVSVLAPNTVPVDDLPNELGSAFLVMGMWVDLCYRRRGIGNTLLQEGVAWAQSAATVHGVPDNDSTASEAVQMALKTHWDNVAATKLYASADFRPMKDSAKDGSADVWMVKSCSPIQSYSGGPSDVVVGGIIQCI